MVKSVEGQHGDNQFDRQRQDSMVTETVARQHGDSLCDKDCRLALCNTELGSLVAKISNKI